MKYKIILVAALVICLVTCVTLFRKVPPSVRPISAAVPTQNQSSSINSSRESTRSTKIPPTITASSKVGNRYVSIDDVREFGLTEPQINLLATELDRLVPRIYDLLAVAAHVAVLDDKTRKVTFDVSPDLVRSAKDAVGHRIQSILPQLSDAAVEQLVNSRALAANFEMYGETSLVFHFDSTPISRSEAVLIKREYVDPRSGVQVATEGIAVIEGFQQHWGTLATKVMN